MHPRNLFFIAALALAGCGDDPAAVIPGPQALTRDHIGHYCNMIIKDHAGPKSQIYVAGRKEGYWFSSVRDGIAFTLLPEEPRNIVAVYVHDMAKAKSWADPGPDAWINAKDALYVIGSAKRGGMGALESVPFSDRKVAQSFVANHGGEIVDYGAVPKEYILAEAVEKPMEMPPEKPMTKPMATDHKGMGHGKKN